MGIKGGVKPTWQSDSCIFCGVCQAICPEKAITVSKPSKSVILDERQILEVHLNAGEPIQNVPRSLKDEGHKVLSLNDNGKGTFTLLVKKGGSS